MPDPEQFTAVALRPAYRFARERADIMLVVSHEMAFAKTAADRVVMMDEGRIVEEGPPARMFSDEAEPRTREFLARIV